MCLLILSACASHAPDSAEPAVALGIEVPYFQPLPADRHPTTPGPVLLSNLNQRIAVQQDRMADSSSGVLALMLAGSLEQRYRILGRSADLEQALRLADQSVNDGGQASAYLLRARLRLVIHQFNAALEDLDRAAGLGADPAALATTRAEVLRALGRNAEAQVLMGTTPPGSLVAQAYAANRLLEQGEYRRSLEAYFNAERSLSGTHPLPLAWVQSQMGIAYLRLGHPAQASAWFRSALKRLPGYALAQDHLAEALVQLEELDEAEELYRELVADETHPEFLAALAGLLERKGHFDAGLVHEQARAAFESYGKKWPASVRRHAAEYALAQGRRDEALKLASRELDLRQDPSTLRLMASVLAANGQPARACEMVERLAGRGNQAPETVSLGRELCP